MAAEVDGGKRKRGELLDYSLCMTVLTDNVYQHVPRSRPLEKLYLALSESLLLCQKLGSFCLRYWKQDTDLLGTGSR